MQVNCPHCQTVLDLSPFAPGTVIACANCQQNLTVPAPVFQPKAVSIVPTPKKPRSKVQQAIWKQPAVIICAFVVFFLISGCCIFSSVLDYSETPAPHVADSKPEPDEASKHEASLWDEFDSARHAGSTYRFDSDYQNAKQCYLDALFVLEAIEESYPNSEHPIYGSLEGCRVRMNDNVRHMDLLMM